MERLKRLEVSGTQLAGHEVSKRLRAKLKQAKAGKSDLPALACVVGFRTRENAITELAVADNGEDAS